MDTLIKLLNEYEEDKIKGTQWLSVMYIWKWEWTLHYYNNYKSENVFDNVRYLIISKEYWFIEWLVQKDKINLWKIQKLYRKSNGNSTATYPILYDYTYDESLLMFLAIQENAISFLLSILN